VKRKSKRKEEAVDCGPWSVDQLRRHGGVNPLREIFAAIQNVPGHLVVGFQRSFIGGERMHAGFVVRFQRLLVGTKIKFAVRYNAKEIFTPIEAVAFIDLLAGKFVYYS
jgi:hypothetical protein